MLLSLRSESLRLAKPYSVVGIQNSPLIGEMLISYSKQNTGIEYTEKSNLPYSLIIMLLWGEKKYNLFNVNFIKKKL